MEMRERVDEDGVSRAGEGSFYEALSCTSRYYRPGFPRGHMCYVTHNLVLAQEERGDHFLLALAP